MIALFLPRRLVDFEYLGGSGDSTDVEYDRLASQYHKDIDFAFYFVNFGTTKSEFLELTRREKAFIRKAWEDKQVRESELMRNAVLNAVSNAMRKKALNLLICGNVSNSLRTWKSSKRIWKSLIKTSLMKANIGLI